LLRAGLVHSRRDGTRIHYSLASPTVAELWHSLRHTSEQHVADLDRLAAAYLGDRAQLETMTRQELRSRLRVGDVVVLDVRPAPEYDAGHIRGAVSIPITELRDRLDELPEDREVVAYCRGPYCVYADDAVRLLAERGVAARRLDDGFPEWAIARLPVARST
jgi:rhodanese-related sulfurtransferase